MQYSQILVTLILSQINNFFIFCQSVAVLLIVPRFLKKNTYYYIQRFLFPHLLGDA